MLVLQKFVPDWVHLNTIGGMNACTVKICCHLGTFIENKLQVLQV